MNEDLISFINQSHYQIQSDYERIQKKVLEDPGTAGDQGEENWSDLLKNWLSPTFPIITKGKIINFKGETSPQIDVIVLKPEYPQKLQSNKHILSDGVLAAFECKLTLRKSHLPKIFETSAKIKKLSSVRKGNPYFELQSPIIYGVLANSHEWKSDPKTVAENLTSIIQELDYKYVKHPIEMIDLFCIANLGTWSASKWPLSVFGNEEGNYNISHTFYMNFLGTSDFDKIQRTPVGSLISTLVNKIAYEHTSIQWLAHYYRTSQIGGSGKSEGKFWRKWPYDIYTEMTQKKLKSNNFNNEMWDYWGYSFG
jgi:hypothetical protein